MDMAMLSTPAYSRAAVLRSYRAPICIEEVPIPKVIEPGALLVKVDTCSVCGTDVHLWQGHLSRPVDLPVIIGHEMVGHIVAFGAAADRDSVGQPLQLGDRVVWTHSSCGNCFFCTVAEQPMLCTHRRAYMYESMEKFPYLLGGFSEYGYVLPESGRVRVPDEVPDELASLCSCAFRSVMNAFDEIGRLETSEVVVIQGAGPLGLLAVALARHAGVSRVIVIGAPNDRLELARQFGADATLSIQSSTPEERLKEIKSLTAGRGADIVMDFAGVPAAFDEGLSIVRRGGRYLVVGQLGEGKTTLQPSIFVRKNLRLIGSLSGGARAYWKALDFVAKNRSRYPFERMISNVYGLDQVNNALTRMKNQEEIKPIIRIA
jgi:threonine dehydrogenase-like Zn-dependent dehydrogenase